MTSAPRPLPEWLTITTGRAPAVVDGRACRTRAAFFAEVARVLRLPGYFGHNWDALTDSLRDIGNVHLVVEHAGDLLAAEPAEQFATLLAVLAGAAEDGLTLTLCTDSAHEAPLRRRTAEGLA
ncbi:barstar family protein [Microbispora triticiradicis]|uniref:Barstar family protein n=3 Tax=Microbispora TaxID=2005 RepID=A0ABY3M660_9ACTN|nr:MULTISPECIES: barstar family protein [Microbispora]MBO4270593.1 barnase inhibitor [Microbispora triticiradicis]RGA00404.1 barnase inhibitor [Microbispora triticiradicis]TLP66392.1 barstar family protein [Microbispora fusca]TYB68176.1 barstar family protein [Microbispora tritici]